MVFEIFRIIRYWKQLYASYEKTNQTKTSNIINLQKFQLPYINKKLKKFNDD